MDLDDGEGSGESHTVQAVQVNKNCLQRGPRRVLEPRPRSDWLRRGRRRRRRRWRTNVRNAVKVGAPLMWPELDVQEPSREKRSA